MSIILLDMFDLSIDNLLNPLLLFWISFFLSSHSFSFIWYRKNLEQDKWS